MYTLYPPLDSDSESCDEGECLLSTELQESFKTLSSIHREQCRRKNEEELATGDIVTTETEAIGETYANGVNTKTTYEMRVKREILEAKKVEVARLTAMTVESEIARLQNGIAELENILHQQDSDENVDNSPYLQPNRGDGCIENVARGNLSMTVE